ncbi:hypothetical protein JCM5350_004268 [Sporobolomyces pararoseus]
MLMKELSSRLRRSTSGSASIVGCPARFSRSLRLFVLALSRFPCAPIAIDGDLKDVLEFFLVERTGMVFVDVLNDEE